MWHTKKRFPLSAHFPSLSLSNVWSPSSGDKWWLHSYTKINFKELLCHTAVTFVQCSVLHLLSCRHKMKHKQHWYEAQWTFHAFRLTAYIKLSLLLWCLPPCRLLSSVHLYELTFFVTPPPFSVLSPPPPFLCFFLLLLFTLHQVFSLADARPIGHASYRDPPSSHSAPYRQTGSRAVWQEHVRVSIPLAPF